MLLIPTGSPDYMIYDIKLYGSFNLLLKKYLPFHHIQPILHHKDRFLQREYQIQYPYKSKIPNYTRYKYHIHIFLKKSILTLGWKSTNSKPRQSN